MNNNLNYYISIYFKDYLPNVLGLSKNTILSYRDSFSILLIYLKENKKININSIKIDEITYDTIIDFLNYIEKERKNSIATRNQRLSAILTFYNFIKVRELSYLDLFTQILSIPIKKAPKSTISYFSTKEISILINLPNTKTKFGFRDYVLLLFMYETAARAQELSDLKISQLQINNKHPYVILIGKGDKSRRIPITNELSNILKKYLLIFNVETDDFVFFNRTNNKITTKGIEYILIKYIELAKNDNKDLFKYNYSNYSMRHSKAMHLLESGVNLIYIRDFLGHESIVTTQIYAKTSPIIKEKQIIEHSKNLNIKNKYDIQEKEGLIKFFENIMRSKY